MADFATVLHELHSATVDLNAVLQRLVHAYNEHSDTDTGVSLLDVKNHQLLSYIGNLVYVVSRMCAGRSVASDDALRRLVEIRAVLERIRPIEKHMQSQIDRIVTESTDDRGEPVARARPEQMVVADDGEDDEGGASGDEGRSGADGRLRRAGGGKAYVPPRLVAMHYERDEATGARGGGGDAGVRSDLMRELHAQYSLAPEELVEHDDGGRGRRQAVERRRLLQGYEEENMVRLQIDRKRERAARAAAGTSTLDSLLQFGSYGLHDPKGKPKEKGARGKAKGKRRPGLKSGGKKGAKGAKKSK